jgi:hypothetical protein
MSFITSSASCRLLDWAKVYVEWPRFKGYGPILQAAPGLRVGGLQQFAAYALRIAIS